ncbi:hypothetical protein [Nannocystis sp.]|uniref:hypothetical protein n=1 Tax=Nannocystis sp. TaxID=1962667 RepID=UPI0025E19D73|nr:hypothetical protein [Nannocystis sp.]MBK7830182.1 hypothetical protein [Nannocystis sp.]
MRAACSLILALLGCGAEAAGEASGPGPDCAVWIAAGERARGCDPAIAGLLLELQARPEERRCRAAARQLLAPLRAEPPRIVSVYEPATPADAGPLTAEERAALLGMALPGTVVVTPDLAPGPGVPVTTAELGGVPLAVDGDGRLRGTRAPGEHTLALRHANAMSRSCVTLRACETVALTGHGAEVAPHPSLRAGPCP